MVPGPSRSQSPITVAIVDGDLLFRNALRLRLAAESDIELIAEASDAFTGIELAIQQRPDLVLVQVALPDRSGCEAMQEILSIAPETRVIMLAAEADEATQVEALRAGAVGFLPKSINLDVLPRVLRGVRAGEAAVSRSVAMRLVEEARER
ncbi:MAG TPA: response regulator transcription factor [Solirubrobacterales bacterium]|jgi:DNA-binding NarL/FixJ family response regulator